MKKNAKIVTILLMITAAMLALAGCFFVGGGNNGGDTGDNGSGGGGGGGGDVVDPYESQWVRFYNGYQSEDILTSSKTGKIEKMPENPVREHAEFIGWFLSDDFSVTDEFNPDDVITEAIEVYARFRYKVYTVSFDSDGGGEISPVSTNEYTGTLDSLPSPSKSGYRFDGWYTKNGVSDQDLPEYYRRGNVFTADTTLYANYYQKAIEYTASYSSDEYFDILGTKSVISVYGAKGSEAVEEIEIPQMLQGLPVTVVKDWGFRLFTKLKKIVLPDTLKVIGYEAFDRCEALSDITIPDSVIWIETDSFYGCRNIPYIVENGVRYLNKWLIKGEIGTQNANLVIKEGTVGIAGNAFHNTGATSVKLPASLRSICSYAFNDAAITSITIPANTKYIRPNSMSRMLALKSLTVESGNEKVCAENDVLYNIDKTELYTSAAMSAKTSLTVPSTVKTIAEDAFEGSKNLQTIVLPERLETIEQDSFKDASALKELNIPASVTKFAPDAGMYALENINIAAGNTLYTSKSGVLYSKDGKTLLKYPGGRNIKTITLGEDLTADKYGSECFIDSGSLVAVFIKSSVKELDYCFPAQTYAFCEPAKIPASWRGLLPNQTYLDATKDNYVESDNLHYSLFDSVLHVIGYTGEGNKTVVIPESFKVNNSEVPYFVTEIKPYVFSKKDSLTVYIPKYVITIQNYAFYNCTNLTVNCEVADKPSGWVNNWVYKETEAKINYNRTPEIS